ncbi:MAG: HAMP domain-containing protein [Pseudomonadota bacterium]
MSIRIKMFLSSLLVVLLVGLTGFFGLRASKRSLDSLESGEKQSWHIVINSNNVSSNVKQSEFDLMLFLALGHPEDKEHYYENTKALTRQIAWLKQNVSIPQGLLLLQRISSGAEAFYPAAEALIKVHDEDRSTLGSFDAERHADLVRTLNNLASDVRENGVALANLQAASLSKHSAITAATEINSYAKRAGTHLLLFLTLNSLEDKSKFYQRCKSIQEQINILTSLLITPPAMAILERMKSDFAELSAAGKALIAAYDDEMKKNGRLAPENYSGLIVKLVSSCSALSQEGFALMEFEIKLQQDLDSGTKSYYGNIQSNIVLVSLVSLILILCFNFILSKKIADRLITLKKSLRAFGEGKLETVSASTVNDEIGELSRSFKKMAEDLRQTMVSRDYVENILKSKLSRGESIFFLTLCPRVDSIQSK